MFVDVLFVAIGAALGGVGRFLVGQLVKSAGGFPWATFTVNVVGSLLLGFLSGWLARPSQLSSEAVQMIRCFAVVGVCGGFTTFSTFSNETFRLLEGAQWSLALLYAVVSLLAGLAAVFLGSILSFRVDA